MAETMQCDISVGIMTHNEITEFGWLMEALAGAQDIIGEIVIVDDFSSPAFIDKVTSFQLRTPVRFFQRALHNNFAKQRNFLKSLCRGKLIFFPDADEVPPSTLLRGLPQLLAWMEALEIDACQLPRFNVWIEDGELAHPSTVDLSSKELTILWEDQFRILRNLPYLHWTMRLNEYLTGVRRAYRFPHTFDYALLHCKTRERQRRQMVFYRGIRARHLSRLKNSVFKRLPWRRPPEWISAQAPI